MGPNAFVVVVDTLTLNRKISINSNAVFIDDDDDDFSTSLFAAGFLRHGRYDGDSDTFIVSLFENEGYFLRIQYQNCVKISKQQLDSFLRDRVLHYTNVDACPDQVWSTI